MGLDGILEKVTDAYERQARLWPALLALLPLIVLVELMYASEVSLISNAILVASSCGGLYLMTNICRDMGKRLEPKLYETWGGKPTTQLLRHKDKTIDDVTKRRYHAFLAGKINEPFPDLEKEIADPASADSVYQSAVRWLLNQTRDTEKFSLLLKENIAYGFRRNALGVKPIGLVICFGSLAWVLLSEGGVNLNSLSTMPNNAMVSLLASSVMMMVWVFFFTKVNTRTAAFTYAETLLRACDSL